MNAMNANLGEANLRKGNRPPIEDPDSLEDQDLQGPEQGAEVESDPDGDLDLDLSSNEDQQELGEDDAPAAAIAPSSARFENIKVGLRKLSAEHCIIGIDLELVLDTSEPGSETGAETGADDPEATEYNLDSEEVEAMLAEHAPRKVAPRAAPAGRAGASLMAAKAPQAKPRAKLKIDRKKYFHGYNATFGKLDQRQMKGLHGLLTAAEADPHLTDIRWLAYILATVQHECGGTWLPLRERGRGAGMKYGKPVVVTDPQGRKYRNVYYGRGYVQLTWDYNYRKMGKLLKNRLLYEPDLALRPSVAYRILFEGMRRGSFTHRKLSDYIHGNKTDYVNARRVINGVDRAQKIARYAVKQEKLLRRSRVRATGNPPH